MSCELLGNPIFEGSKVGALEIEDIEKLKKELGETQTTSDLFVLAIDSLKVGSDIFKIDEKDRELDKFLTFEKII